MPKNISKIIGKNKSKKLSGKYSQKLFHHPKQSAADALKAALKKVIKKDSRDSWWFDWQ